MREPLLRLFRLSLYVIAGLGVAGALGLEGLEHATWYAWIITIVLTIGLFGAASGIPLDELRNHKWLVFRAVTIGVLMKAVLIGAPLAAWTHNPFYLVMGVALAQIDPVAINALMHRSKMTPAGRAILVAWAALDDPITAVLSLTAPSVIKYFGGDVPVMAGQDSDLLHWAVAAIFSLLGLKVLLRSRLAWNIVRWTWVMLCNIGLAWLAAKLWDMASRRPRVQNAVLITMLMAAIGLHLFLASAFFGLKMRRDSYAQVLDRVVDWTFKVVLVMLGMLVSSGVDWVMGVVVGGMVYCAHAVTATLLTIRLPLIDRIYLRRAQLSGITAMSLALGFEPDYKGAIAIAAPTILVVYLLHMVFNYQADRKVDKLGLA